MVTSYKMNAHENRSDHVLYKPITEKIITKRIEQKASVWLLKENSNDASSRNTYVINA